MAEDTKTRKRFHGELTLDAVTDEAKAERQGTDLTPFLDILRKGMEKKAAGHNAPAHGVTVPADGAQLAETRFRQAATILGIGVSIEVIKADSDKGRAQAVPAGKTKLVVETRDRKKVGEKKSPAEKTTAPVKKGLPPTVR